MTTLDKLARLRTEWWLVLSLSAAVLAALVHFGTAERLDYLIYDWLLRSGIRESPAQNDRRPEDIRPADILIVAVDNRSLAEVGPWPWPRDTEAALIEKIIAGAPRALALDLLLVDRRDPAGDARLAKAMAGPVPVYLPLAFNVPGPDGAPFATEQPLPEFIRAAAGVGHVNLAPDRDGVIRRIFLQYDAAGNSWAALPALLAGLPATAAVGTQADLVGRHSVMIDYRGGRGSYPTIPAASVLRGEVPASVIAGRTVLLGVTASGLGDSHATPVSGDGALMPGVEIQANVVTMLRTGDAIDQPGGVFPFLMALMPLMSLFVAMRALSARGTGLAAVVLAAAVSAVCWALFHFAGIWLGPSCALIGIALAYPIWAWRKLAVASGYISRELERAAAEAGDIAHAVPAGGGSLDRQLALLEDTTNRDRELRRQREDVLRLLTHDMRAPQSSIIALLDGDAAHGVDAALAERIRGYARRTLELADNFVNLSRAQLLEFTPHVLDLTELARDAADALWPQARLRGIRIEVVVADGAEDGAEVLVSGEPSLLTRMLINLADNAIKYGATDGVITLSVVAEGGRAIATVSNPGPDIPSEQIAVLFDHFSRAAGQSPGTDGVGLGLAFVQTVAQRHGGTVSCRSGGGTTTFTVHLPQAADLPT